MQSSFPATHLIGFARGSSLNPDVLLRKIHEMNGAIATATVTR